MQKLMKRFHKNQKGFTLVELMVVVVIIGILVAIAIPIYQNVTKNAEKKACHANQRTIDGACAMYEAENNGTPPANMAALADYLDDHQNIKCPAGDTPYTIANGRVNGCPVDSSNHGKY